MGKVAYSRSADSRHLLPEWRRAFCDVRDPAKSVIIELDDDYFDALIVEVDDPLFAAEQIRARLHK
jgi:hypothetical protein